MSGEQALMELENASGVYSVVPPGSTLVILVDVLNLRGDSMADYITWRGHCVEDVQHH